MFCGGHSCQNGWKIVRPRQSSCLDCILLEEDGQGCRAFLRARPCPTFQNPRASRLLPPPRWKTGSSVGMFGRGGLHAEQTTGVERRQRHASGEKCHVPVRVCAEESTAADCLQRPLVPHSRCRQRLSKATAQPPGLRHGVKRSLGRRTKAAWGGKPSRPLASGPSTAILAINTPHGTASWCLDRRGGAGSGLVRGERVPRVWWRDLSP